ncbi:hypothetical protein LINPERHAP2_LOCUS35018 [Linum perenne]
MEGFGKKQLFISLCLDFKCIRPDHCLQDLRAKFFPYKLKRTIGETPAPKSVPKEVVPRDSSSSPQLVDTPQMPARI